MVLLYNSYVAIYFVLVFQESVIQFDKEIAHFSKYIFATRVHTMYLIYKA